MTSELTVVLVQILVIWAVLIRVYLLAARRDGRPPIDDIGVFWLLAFTLYATLPPLSWLFQGGAYGPLSGRLFRLQPEASEVAYLLSIALAYVFGFASVYFVFLRQVGRPVLNALAYIGDAKMAGAIVIMLLASLFGVIFYSSSLVRPAESYVDAYAVVATLPLGLRQIIRITGEVQNIAIIVFTIGLIQRWPRHRLLFFVYIFSILFSFDPEGSRTGLAKSLLMIVIVWHVLIRPISFGKLLCGGIVALLAFILFGIWRNFGSLTGIDAGLGLGEFDVLWGNAVELWQAKKSGQLDMPWAARFGEFFAFVPSQLLWFEKASPSIWYLDTFYPEYKEAGGGWAFGAISQAVIGGGVVEAAIRGAVLGALAGWIMKWVRRPSKAWWHFPLYLYLIVLAYQSTRDTTFTLWASVVQTVIPGLILIAIIGALLATRRAPAPKNDPA